MGGIRQPLLHSAARFAARTERTQYHDLSTRRCHRRSHRREMDEDDCSACANYGTLQCVPALVLARTSGAGISPLPVIAVEHETDLVRLFDSIPELRLPFYLLIHRDMRRTPRVRAFCDFVSSEIKAFRELLVGHTDRTTRSPGRVGAAEGFIPLSRTHHHPGRCPKVRFPPIAAAAEAGGMQQPTISRIQSGPACNLAGSGR